MHITHHWMKTVATGPYTVITAAADVSTKFDLPKHESNTLL
nr:MAG TPA: hypothetical protein [Caudoviricetes sp.]